MFKKYVILALCTLTVGCQSMMNTDFFISNEQMIDMYPIGEDSGYLVARIGIEDANEVPGSVFLHMRHQENSGLGAATEIRMFPNHDPLVVMRVRSGTYTWEDVDYMGYGYSMDLKGTEVQVAPGSFNYIGDIYFSVQKKESGRFFARMGGTDKSDVVEDQIQKTFPVSSEKYPFLNQVSIPKPVGG